jgi:hypothetical protein
MITTIEEEQMEWYEKEAQILMRDAVHAAVKAEELFQKGLDDEGNAMLDKLDEMHAKALELDKRLVKDMERWAVKV